MAEPMTGAQLAQAHQLWEDGLSAEQVIAWLEANGTPPPDGFPRWTWMALSKVMDRIAVQQRQRRSPGA